MRRREFMALIAGAIFTLPFASMAQSGLKRPHYAETFIRSIQFSRNLSRKILPRSLLGSSGTTSTCLGILAGGNYFRHAGYVSI